MKNYKIIGSGTYGDIYLLDDGNVYKDLKKTQDTSINEKLYDFTILREFSCIQTLKKCSSTINNFEIFRQGKHIGYKMPFYQFDLGRFMGKPFSLTEIKNIIFKISMGLLEIHSHLIMHRDLKPSNILISKDLKNLIIIDWGLCKFVTGEIIIDEIVQTLWYRAPELILDIESYDYSIDIWSLGIIFLDMIMGTYGILGRKKELDQLSTYINNLKYPDNWLQGDSKLEKYKLKKPEKGNSLFDSNEKLKNFDKDGINLLESMLEFNPKKRITLKEILKHKFFSELVTDIDEVDLDYRISKITNLNELYEIKLFHGFHSLIILDNEKYIGLLKKIPIINISNIEINMILVLFNLFMTNYVNEINDEYIDTYFVVITNLFLRVQYASQFELKDIMRYFKVYKSLIIEEIIITEDRILNLINNNLFFKTPALLIENIIKDFVLDEEYNIICVLLMEYMKLNCLFNYKVKEVIGSLLYLSHKIAKTPENEILNYFYPKYEKFIISFLEKAPLKILGLYEINFDDLSL